MQDSLLVLQLPSALPAEIIDLPELDLKSKCCKKYKKKKAKRCKKCPGRDACELAAWAINL